MKRVTLFLLFVQIYLSAHPHTFIDVYPKINNKENLVTTITFEWKFDLMTSQLLIMEFDTNMDGKIDKDENDYIYTNYFDPLKDYGYYTDIRIDKKAITPEVKNFKTFIDSEQRINYSFEIEINTDKDRLYIDFYDEESFTAFVLKKEFITSEIPYKVIDVDNDFYFSYRVQFKE